MSARKFVMTGKTFAFLAILLTTMIVAGAAQTPAPNAADQLYAAIRAGDTVRLRALVDGGADVNVKDRRGGATPLMHAAAIGSLEAMQLLLDKGADVNARNAAEATALMWAATDISKIRLLLDRGADINAASSLGHTVLQLAAMSDGSAEIVRLLLARGANPSAVDKDKMTTLAAATIGNDTETIRQLIAAGVQNAAGLFGTTPLMNAAANGNVDAVKVLLAKGANVNAVSDEPAAVVKNGTIQIGRLTALQLASSFGPADLVKTLIAAGANVNVKEARGMTPLMLAVATDHGDVEIVKTLIASGAELNVKSLAGETPLDWAQKSGSTPIVAELKRAGAVAAMPTTAHSIADPAPTAVRPAVERSLALLERSSGTFFTNGACGACHAQNVTDFAALTARKHGFSINETAAAQRAAGAAGAFGAIASALLERVDGPTVDIFLYTLGGLAAGSYQPDRATDALIANTSAQQRRDGSWHLGGIARPPIEDGDFSRTALGIRALKVYGLPARSREMTDRIQRAATWLQKAKALTTEDRSFRVLGLAWSGATTEVLRPAVSDLLAGQRSDGGWAQREEMSPDAYATGLALFALRESGALSSADAAIQKGAAYLLSTQRADGSWFVRSRSPKFQPYFEGGFPYEHDQWISAMATGWAAAALAASSPPVGATAAR